MFGKKILWLTMFVFIIQCIYGQNYSAQTWTILYKKSVSLKEKREKVKQMVDIATPDFENLIVDILTEQVTIPEYTGSIDKKMYEEWVNYTVIIAGKLKMKSTSPALKKLYTRLQSPRLKGDIVYNIGLIGNKDDMPYLLDELRVFNITQKAGKLAGREEILAGLLKAVDLYKDESCFNDLFDSFLLAYSERTKKMADDAIKNITGTPSLLCEKYIVASKEYIASMAALQYSMKSNSPGADKIKAASTALTISLDVKTTADAAVVDAQKKLGNAAIFNLGELKAADPVIVQLIARKWDLDMDSMSNIITIEAFQKIATNEANKLLVNKLAFLTQKAKEGGGTGFSLDEGNKVTIAIIRALGEIGNKESIDELLNAVYTLEYGKPIINEAQKALDKINAKK